MKTFTIDVDDNLTAFDAGDAWGTPPIGTERFRSECELSTLAASWRANRLVDIWNSLPGVQPVKRFTDRATAVTRVWKAIKSLEPACAKQMRTAGSKLSGSRSKASLPQKAETGQRNTRGGQVVALLERPGGASLKVIMAATAWQAHSVRGFISGHLRKKQRLRVKSFKRNGERVYAIRKRTKSH